MNDILLEMSFKQFNSLRNTIIFLHHHTGLLRVSLDAR
jgi:hypothetical protein